MATLIILFGVHAVDTNVDLHALNVVVDSRDADVNGVYEIKENLRSD